MRHGAASGESARWTIEHDYDNDNDNDNDTLDSPASISRARAIWFA
jgi:hypothetical protein